MRWFILTAGIWTAVSFVIFVAVVAWRRAFPAPMPRIGDPTLDTGYRRRHFSPEVAAQRHGLVAGMTVLEVGPAIGYLTPAATQAVGPRGRVIALDLMRPALRKLRKRLGALTPPMVCGDASKLPFRSGTFDLSFLSSVLGEIPDKPAALRELKRVVRPGGTLAISEEIIFDPDYVRLPVARRLAAECGFAFGEYFGQRFRYTQRFTVPAAAQDAASSLTGTDATNRR